MPESAARRRPENLPGLDYRREAARLGKPVAPIIDAHTHVNGAEAAGIFLEAATLYGVERTYSQTQLALADRVRGVLGDRVRFIAVPDWSSPDRSTAFRQGFLDHIRIWHRDHGARMIKLWAAPRLRDFADAAPEEFVPLDAPWRVKAAELAASLGMMILTHVADPDTWFQTKYSDAKRYGTKRSHYDALERMLERFPTPWIAAHLGGSPEDLDFLSGLLERHANLHLDCSATKWMVRELSRHPTDRVVEFFTRWRGRILFGSDIVTSDDHLHATETDPKRPMAHLAGSREEAFDLYASRYWALRTLLETDHDGPSPIADPDLAMVDPARFDAMSPARLKGHRLAPEVLKVLYRGAAENLVERWYREHGSP